MSLSGLQTVKKTFFAHTIILFLLINFVLFSPFHIPLFNKAIILSVIPLLNAQFQPQLCFPMSHGTVGHKTGEHFKMDSVGQFLHFSGKRKWKERRAAIAATKQLQQQQTESRRPVPLLKLQNGFKGARWCLRLARALTRR